MVQYIPGHLQPALLLGTLSTLNSKSWLSPYLSNIWYCSFVTQREQQLLKSCKHLQRKGLNNCCRFSITGPLTCLEACPQWSITETMRCRRFILWLLPLRRTAQHTQTTLSTSTIWVLVRPFVFKFKARLFFRQPMQLCKSASVWGACFSSSLITPSTLNLSSVAMSDWRNMELFLSAHIAFISFESFLPSCSTTCLQIRASPTAWRAIDFLFLLPTLVPRRFKDLVRGKIRELVGLFTHTFKK